VVRRRCRRQRLEQEVDHLSDRLEALERRLEDTEDTLWAALAPDRLDDLCVRVDSLAADAATHEQLLEVRLHVTRVATELDRVTTELRTAVDQARAGTDPGGWVASA
jgi:predicted  nucleic acid-binding Zn-ribbon protein